MILTHNSEKNRFSGKTELTEDGTLIFVPGERLDSHNTGYYWKKIDGLTAASKPKSIKVDASNLKYCDGIGVGLLFRLRIIAGQENINISIENLDEKISVLLDNFDVDAFAKKTPEKRKPTNVAEDVGKWTLSVLSDIREQIAFIGEVFLKIFTTIANPAAMRWHDFCLVAERSGVNAVGIIATVGFLFGLIMAFSGVISLEQFGAEVYVANMVAIALVRVLGPFITAVMLSGRSGSAFAAEIGTMKINEELDALETMNIDPVRFLVVPRVLATTIMTPLLTVLANLAGLVGSAIVLVTLNIPLVTYIDRVKGSVDLGDLLGGLFKSLVYGMIIGAVGCLRGMKTEAGPSAVGNAATQAVVTAIILIIISEGVFAVLYYNLGI